MNIFTSKSKYNIGMKNDNYSPPDLMEIYNRVKARKLALELEEAEDEREELEKWKSFIVNMELDYIFV